MYQNSGQKIHFFLYFFAAATTHNFRHRFNVVVFCQMSGIVASFCQMSFKSQMSALDDDALQLQLVKQTTIL